MSGNNPTSISEQVAAMEYAAGFVAALVTFTLLLDQHRVIPLFDTLKAHRDSVAQLETQEQHAKAKAMRHIILALEEIIQKSPPQNGTVQ
ncbi:hypothetical protein MXH48_002759 [Salmonella enterica]|nr:hypothetical protein [Salmonella enterica]EJO0243735.1 hypothetical protein [Salmonella enterica]EKK8423241.1 hypothetical protein [Salmonella enterica]EMB4161852.1 hypothetical protein [Salmonella enterica]